MPRTPVSVLRMLTAAILAVGLSLAQPMPARSAGARDRIVLVRTAEDDG